MNAPCGPYDVEAIRARVPDPVAAGLRQAAGLSRQRRLGAEAARRDRRHGANAWRRATPTSIAACTTWPTPRRRRSRTRARTCARFLNAGSTEEIVFTKSATEAYNLVADSLRHAWHRGGRRDHPLDHGAPFQHRALAFPARAQGRGDQMGAGRRRRQLPPRRIREAVLAAHQDRRDHAYVERARHGDAGRRRSCASPTRTACRCSSTARQGAVHLDVDVRDLDCRFLRASPATRSTARPASACSTASANGSKGCRPTRAAAR